MNIITFPAFNLTFEINKEAFTIHHVTIYWYAIIIVLACTISIFLCKKSAERQGINWKTMLNIFIMVIPSSLIGARAYYVLFKIQEYLQDPIQIFNLRDGGLAIYGAIIGAMTCVFIYGKVKKIKVLKILDLMVPYVALGQAIGRWGNFFNQEAYGTQTNSIFRMGIIEGNRYKEVHPTFLYESIADFIIFFILVKYAKGKKREGEVTYVYFILYCFMRFIIEGIRIDSLMIGSFRISQIVSVLLGMISIYMLHKKRLKH